MPSLIQEYEYDIFISYRHNDNLPTLDSGRQASDGWVTDFVQNLEKELRSTLKDTVTIYFDKNPHDGLLETHHVDKSLEGKLKCIIFIPIISQTYCDTKSFAWQHEFCAFNRVANGDAPLSSEKTLDRFPSPFGEGGRRPDEVEGPGVRSFGRDIKLSNGNVASRILPIKIHDLDAEDKALIESEIGGALRAIEFIYKSGGINRPLNSKDDEVRASGKILYRDQVNKVANAIKELIGGIQHSKDLPKQESNQNKIVAKRGVKFSLWVAAIILLIGLVSFGLYYLGGFGSKITPAINRSIAVLPFTDMSPGKDQEYLGDGIAEDIITALSRIKGLKVIGRTSSFQFKGEKIDLRDVGEKLNVSNVLEGSVMKSGNKIRITAQLINVSDGTHIWSERYDKDMDDIFAIQDEISKAISDKMKISLLGNSQSNREKPTLSTEAFENYLLGKQILQPSKGQDAIPFFEKAIQLDSNYADAYAGLASAYFFHWQMSRSERAKHMLPLAQKVLELDPASEKSHELLYMISSMKWDWKLAEEEYQKYMAIKPTPGTGHALRRADIMGDVKGGIEEMKMGLEADPINKTALRLIGRLYAMDHQYEKAKEMINKAIDIDPYFALGFRTLAMVNILEGDFTVALENIKKTEELDSTIATIEYRIWALTKANRMKEAKEVYASNISSLKSKTDYDEASLAKIQFWLGHIDEGFRLLELALQEKDYDILTIRYNPQYDVIRNHPRFKEFMKKVPFPPND